MFGGNNICLVPLVTGSLAVRTEIRLPQKSRNLDVSCLVEVSRAAAHSPMTPH